MNVLKSAFRGLKKTYQEIKNFFKNYLFGSPLQVESYKRESSLHPFFKELNTGLISYKWPLIAPKVGFLLRFLIFLVIALGLSLIRTIDKKKLEKEIKKGELIGKDLGVTAYYDLKDLKRKECAQKFNTLSKKDKVPLINFETDYRLLTFAMLSKDYRLMEKLHMTIDGSKIYYKLPGFKQMVLITDMSVLHFQ